MNEFGDYLKELRTRQGLSQREFAKTIGISNAEVSRLETGKRLDPNIRTLVAISIATGERIETLVNKIIKRSVE